MSSYCYQLSSWPKIWRPYLDQIDLAKRLQASRLLYIKNRNDVLMVKVAEQLHLSQRSQAEHGVVERCDLLDRDLLTRRLVDCGADSS